MVQFAVKAKLDTERLLSLHVYFRQAMSTNLQNQVLPKVLLKNYQGNILVIDDNETNLTVAKSFIEIYGPTVTTALSGKEALEYVKKHRYDLILVDIIMPELDGVETSREIFKIVPDQKILALTAIVSKADLQRCFEVGLEGILTKPLRRYKIEELLSEHLTPSDTSSTA